MRRFKGIESRLNKLAKKGLAFVTANEVGHEYVEYVVPSEESIEQFERDQRERWKQAEQRCLLAIVRKEQEMKRYMAEVQREHDAHTEKMAAELRREIDELLGIVPAEMELRRELDELLGIDRAGEGSPEMRAFDPQI